MKERYLRDGFPWIGAVLAFLLHVHCIRSFPWNFAFDGFQRWAGRDHLLVQGWLPATQVVIWLTHQLGGHLIEARIMLSLVAALAVWFAVRLAGQLAGPVAAAAMVVAASFGPFTVWTSTLYQEGTFLCLLFAGLWFVQEKQWLLADLLIGALGLCRYEGWPYVVLYLIWRRDRKAVRSLAGIGIWLFGYGLLGWRGSRPSPVNIDDWEGLQDQFRPGPWLRDLADFGQMTVNTGMLTWGIVALVGLWLCRRRPESSLMRLIAGMILVQLGITAVWMVGLGDAISRMLVVPGMLTALLATPGIARLWEHRWLRWLGGGGALFLLGVGWQYSEKLVLESAADDSGPERLLLERMEQCPDCVWWIDPRAGFGPKDRHDACEVLQGLSNLRRDQDFWCSAWIPESEWAEKKTACTGWVRWFKPENAPGRYLIRTWEKGATRGNPFLDPAPSP